MSFTTLIDVESLAGLLSAPAAARPVILDCRFDLATPDAGRAAYALGHIPGAHYADLNRDLSGPVTRLSGRHPLPSPAAAAALFASMGIAAAADGGVPQVIAYDASNGSFAARAWWLLRWLKIARVAVLDGGFAAWTAADGAVESGAPGAIPGTVPHLSACVPDAAALVSAAAVLAALPDPRRLLVDARAPERFAGSIEPLDAVAGHVPGAVNHPFTCNLTAAGRFLPTAQLYRLWQDRLGGRDPRDVMLMCGSGVTACHNLLAMEHAGLPGAKLYAGSWSEWIRDPERPVAGASAGPAQSD